MSSIEPAEVVEMLAVTPIHDLQKTLDAQGVDIWTFFEDKDLRRLDFSRIKQGLSLSSSGPTSSSRASGECSSTKLRLPEPT
jgi:hypothetical protein